MSFRALSEEVWLCIHPTRREDFAAYVEAGGLAVPEPFFKQAEDHPVVNISWEDAQRFARWLTEYEQALEKISAQDFYRLPTEAEWMDASGVGFPEAGDPTGGRSLVFCWGDRWPPPNGIGNFSPMLAVDDYEYTSPVKTFPPNARGFYDMTGNVWEWCEDTFEGATDMRVLKGGSWRMHEPSRLALNRRIGNPTGLRLPTYGFRLALVRAGGAMPAETSGVRPTSRTGAAGGAHRDYEQESSSRSLAE